MQPTRLFDFLTLHCQKTPQSPFLSAKEQGQWRSHSFAQVQQLSNQLSQLLLTLGLQKGDKIAIISENRPEWNVVDLGALQIGVVSVPMYPNISERDYAFIFNDAGIKYAFVGNEAIWSKVQPLLGKVESLRGIYTFDGVGGAEPLRSSLPAQVDETAIENRRKAVSADDLATIIYTSGTTGNPKGVMLTHRNIVSNILSVRMVTPFDEGRRTLSFLPLCHSFERMVFYAYLSLGMHIYYAENLEKIGDNLKEVKPFCFTTVPRLLEKVYEKIMAKGNALTGFKKTLFFWAIGVGSQYEVGVNKGWWYNLKLKIARKLIFSKWREALGGELEFIVTGAAAMQPRLITLFTAAGIPVIEGYGLTETSPVLAVNRIDEQQRCIGTVGIPLPNVEIKMAEDGEILAKGDNIMKGYYNRPDLTDEVITDGGWFHTGDIGIWVERNGHKFLKITDRKKELFKTAGGKYIAPQVIENKMKESPYIEQIMVVGGDDKKFIAALIVPSFMQLTEYAKQQQIAFSNHQALVENPKIMALLDQEVQQLNKHFGQWEQIKKIHLIGNEWSVESGELTPTMKLKRKVLFDKYAKEIESLFTL